MYNPRNMLSTYWTVCDLFAAACASNHVTTLKKNTVYPSIHTDLTLIFKIHIFFWLYWSWNKKDTVTRTTTLFFSVQIKLLLHLSIRRLSVIIENGDIWPLNGSATGGKLVLIQTSVLLFWQSNCFNAKLFAFKWEKQRGLYQSKDSSTLACIQ